MKNKTLFIIFFFIAITFLSKASDTLYFRFSNYVVIDASPYDTLTFDLEIKSSTTGTYLAGFQTDINFNTTVFGTNAQPVSITPLDMVGPAMIITAGPSNPHPYSFRYAIAAIAIGNPYDPATLSLVPTTSWGKLIRYKMLVLNNTQDLGMSFDINLMTGNQMFVQTITTTLSDYMPIVAANNLLNYPSTPTTFNLLMSELGDPSNSNADFIELYNPGASAIDFSLHSWYLTVFNGATYQDVQLAGSIGAGGTHVIGSNSFAAAYPGKTSDQSSSIIEQDGTVTWYLSVLNPYNDGIMVDLYDGDNFPFNGKHAVRRYNVILPNTNFTPDEWGISPAENMDMTPGSHRVTLYWDGSNGVNWADTANWSPSFVPDVGHNADVPVTIMPPPTVGSGTNANCHDVNNATPGSK